jgi:hypothetical protein
MAKLKLKNVVIVRAPIHVTEEDYFEVRGVSLADLTRLFRRHTEVITKLFNDFMGKKGEGKFSSEMLVEFIQEAAMDFPVLIAEIIALAADENNDEGVDMASNLRATVQIEALLKVMELSITTEAELKKATEILTKAARQITSLVLGVRAQVESDLGFHFPFGSSPSANESIN